MASSSNRSDSLAALEIFAQRQTLRSNPVALSIAPCPDRVSIPGQVISLLHIGSLERTGLTTDGPVADAPRRRTPAAPYTWEG